MARKITKKQKAFADKYIETGSGKESALAVYEIESHGAQERTARSIASENLAKPVIINYIQEALPDELLAEKHKEGLDATYSDEWNSEEADYSVRAKYLDMAYKLKGSYAAEKSINMNISAKDLEKTILDDMKRFRSASPNAQN